MTKVTYLFGAGASANALPIVKGKNGLSDAFLKQQKELQEFAASNEITSYSFNEHISNLEWLAIVSKEYDTVDTYAKYCYLKDPGSLRRLKLTLSLYFTIEQSVNTKMDLRYKVFFTTLTQAGLIFPKNIKLITWNYDYQIELAAALIKEEKFNRSPASKISVRSPGLISNYPCLGDPHNPAYGNRENIDLLHLNGIAGSYYHEGNQQVQNLLRTTSLERLFDLIDRDELDGDHLLTFAWEKQNYIFSDRIEIAKELAYEASILVVIGYSFPFFNREIDREIFKFMTKLKRIYYQDPNRDGKFLKQQFNLPIDCDIVHYEEIEQFFIPPEL